MNILDYIPDGRENAVTREELAQRTGLNDRAVRKLIKEKVCEGIPIMSSSHAKGYWISDSPAELEQFIREAEARHRTEARTIAKLKKALYDFKGQKTVPVRAHLRRIGSGNVEGQIAIGE